VIQSLHRSLSEVSSDVSNTIQGSQAQFEQRLAGNEKLKRDIIHIEEAVSESSSLEALKEQTQFRVEKLVTTLSEQQSNDQQGQEALMALYKKKLAEQAMQSRTDPLTRLPNRQAYNERLEAAFTKFKENGDLLAVAVVDIDHFKSINDRFGHAAGDKTLQVVSKFLKQSLSENDFIARWGGEEFVMLLPQAQMADIDKKLNEKVKITASFGATCFNDNDTTETVFERADEYLYKAKRNGRNLVVTDLSTDL
jgi:diguanylate cyclase (GGDEF)-like protein